MSWLAGAVLATAGVLAVTQDEEAPAAVQQGNPPPAAADSATAEQAPDLQDLQRRLQEAVAGLPGRWGVAVVDLASGQWAGAHAGQIFRTASTLKLPLAMYVLDQAARGQVSLDEVLTYEEGDYEEGTGVLQDSAPGQAFTLRELVELAITQSDNIAANMLLRRFGAQAVVAYERRLGARRTYDEAAGYFVTTPRDMARIMYRLAAGQALPPPETSYLLNLLSHTAFADRLAAGVPPGVTVAHKIGTLPGMVHDVGIIFAPGRTFVMAVMSEGVDDEEAAAAAIAELARLVYNYEVKLARSEAGATP